MAVGSRYKAKTNGQAKNMDMVFNDLNDVVHNAMLSRQTWLNKMMDPRRNIDDECGYPIDIDAYAYRKLYDRDAIAARVVEVMPLECWKVPPTVYEDEDAEVVTPFEEAWDGLAKSVRGESWYEDEEGSPIWEALLRADILSGIGSYGVLLLGIDDGLPLSEPVKGVVEANSFPIKKDKDLEDGVSYPNGQWGGPVYNLTINKAETKGRKLVRLMPFDESSAQVTQWETNRSSPRYGMPVMYLIDFNGPSDQSTGGIGMPMSTENVHWTRVIHIADTSSQGCSSDITVPPRMRPVWNRLMDLTKLYGGSAEMYWRGAFPGLSAETHPQLGGDVAIDIPTTQDQMEQYMNTLQRFIITSGMSVKTLAPTVVDPTPQINIQIEAICIKIAVPIPVFKGYEIGEQASTNNDESWNDRVEGRNNKYTTPRVIIPFVDRLIMMGVLPEPAAKPKAKNLEDKSGEKSASLAKPMDATKPKPASVPPKTTVANVVEDTVRGGYHVKWPAMDAISETEQATIGLTKTQAITTYVGGQGEAIMAPMDFYTRILGMTDEEAQEVNDNVQEHLEESYPDTEETTTPGAVPAAKPPEPPPGLPIKMKEGESLVGPDGQPMNPQAGGSKGTNPFVGNVFCPTGQGGGVDPTCSPSKSSSWRTNEQEEQIKLDPPDNPRRMYHVTVDKTKLLSGERMKSHWEGDSKKGFHVFDNVDDAEWYMESLSSKGQIAEIVEVAIPIDDLANDNEHTGRSYYSKSFKSEYIVNKQGLNTNIFCPTGEGGGVDPSCSKGEANASLVYDKMLEVESSADKGALVTARELRKVSGLSKQDFDKAIYDLAVARKVSPHYHDFASSLAHKELAELIDSAIGDPSRADMHANEGRYWIGVARRNS